MVEYKLATHIVEQGSSSRSPSSLASRESTTAVIQTDDKHFMNIIVAYAPTLVKSEKEPQLREDFYDVLNKLTNDQKKNKHFLLVLGDFNAKTGSGHTQFPENIGKYGKGHMNSSGECLLEYAKENNLVLTNTLFQHKLAHRTTWTSIERTNDHRSVDGTIRRNPYRNQIDYIITKTMHRALIRDSRSYGGIDTRTDHKLVKTTIDLEWRRMKKKRISAPNNFDTDKLHDPETRKVFEQTLHNKLQPQNTESPDETWKRITKSCMDTAKEVLGKKGKHDYNDETTDELQKLSQIQKKLKNDAESTTDKQKRKMLKQERNRTLNSMKILVKERESRKLERELDEIERYKDDSNKYYQAMRKINSKKPKKALKIYDKNNMLITTDEEQLEAITKFFEDLFCDENSETIEIRPAPMEPPYSGEEIEKASLKLKNNKGTGRDEVKAEFIKYGPRSIHDQIAGLLQKTSETGEYPEEIRRGILTPLAKPPKKDVKVNVRPIILLSVLRKISAITLIDRCWDRLKAKIPAEQAAYQNGRSTTEIVFSLKIMAEKAITSENYTIFVLMLDMSKAFDTVNRPKLMNILKELLTESELFMMHVLINDVILNVRIGSKIGRDILTAIGICQGDCLSALLFILYLAYAIKPIPQQTAREDHREVMWSALDWLIRKDEHDVEIDPKYADDITFIRSAEHRLNQVERIIPKMLDEYDLIINKGKTEKYEISRESNDDWKKCKLVGSLLNSLDDINRRKVLVIDTFKTYENALKSRKISEKVKIRIFETYLESVFMYNSEIWAVTKTLEDKIDSFQRKQLRRTLGIIWPRKIDNKTLYERTKQKPWSVRIFKRRMSWFGHLLRLPKDTPARRALRKFVAPTKRPQGRPKTTWLSCVLSDLRKFSDIDLGKKSDLECVDILEHLCSDRKGWNKTINRMMLSKTTTMQ